MSQLLLQGFPEGAIRIGSFVSILRKEGWVYYYTGSDLYHSHPVADDQSKRFMLASLVSNGHCRAVDLERSELNIPYRTIMNWCNHLSEEGSGYFFKPLRRRSGTVMTDELCSRCGMLLSHGHTFADVAHMTGINASTLQKAVRSGRVAVLSHD